MKNKLMQETSSGSLRRAFSPKMIDAFKRGISERDPELVTRALFSGVSPDTMTDDMGHPLQSLLGKTYASLEDHEKAEVSREVFEKNTAQIVDMLFRAGLKVAEPDKHATDNFNYLIDRLIMLEDSANASTAVMHAIYETLSSGRPAYTPDIMDHIYERLDMAAYYTGGKDFDQTSVITQTLNFLEITHDIVRTRLQNPGSDIDRKLVEEFDEKLGEWKGPFNRPSLNTVFDKLQKGASAAPPSDKKGEVTEQEARFMQEMAQYVQVLEKKPVKDVIAAMDSAFIGLDSLKRSARKLVYMQQFELARSIQNIDNTPQNHSTVFLGNPGLGKTTWARKKAELLIAMGLSGPRYVEVSRENMVGGFVGHTENKMVALFKSADIVFIDETYNLNDNSPGSNDFGKKIVDALLTALENRPDLTIFMAGYPKEMEDLLQSNPGLRSRITRFENFDDMTIEQLGATLDLKLKEAHLRIEPAARDIIVDELKNARDIIGEKHFGNARLVRNVVKHLPEAMAERLFAEQQEKSVMIVPNKESLMTVTVADVKALDFKTILGTRKALQEARPAIGFGIPLKKDRIGL